VLESLDVVYDVSNMQRQTVEAARAKDKIEE
jgi:hypothetical protein